MLDNNDAKISKPKDSKKAAKNLINYISKYKIRLLFVLIFAISSTIFAIIGPRILGLVTTKLFEGLMNQINGTGLINFYEIGKIILILLAIYIISSIFSYLQGYIMTDISMKMTYNLRKEISQKINRMPLSYFDKVNHGEILSRITNDIDTLSQSLNQGITQLITSIVTILGIAIMMFSISWQMTLITFGIIPMSFILMSFIVKKSQKYFSGQQKYLGKVNGHVEEMYSGHIIVKAFNYEDQSIEKFNKYNQQLYNSAWKSQFLSGLMMPIVNLVSNLGYVGVCVMGGFLALNNGLAIGDIQAFLTYVRQFTQPLSTIANVSSILQQTMAASERVFEFLYEKEEVGDNKNSIDFSKINIKGNINFSNVSFGYNTNKNVIENFNVNIKKGQKIAIVGPTGSGKTTLVKLLMRFYELNKGDIFIDNINIKNFKKNDLRSIFGMVLQDTWLYNNTILENIRYGNLNATDEDVKKAAKAAQVNHFIKTLPGSYNMKLNEDNSNISQGQKQLLTIARAIISNPKILILDEATSSVDTMTEIHIQKAMDNLMKDKTSFIIAHRLSTIKDADCILVLKDGNIVEQGTHENLLENKGFYFDMYNSQFELQEVI